MEAEPLLKEGGGAILDWFQTLFPQRSWHIEKLRGARLAYEITKGGFFCALAA